MLSKKEHEYFHRLMFDMVCKIEPKFTKGAEEHRGKGDLWDMSDEDLNNAITEELIDLFVYYAEKIRREHERNG